MLLKWLCFFAVALGSPGTANAQAFGIKLGDRIQNYKVLNGDRNFFEVSPPIPHEEMSNYFVITSPQGEICSIAGNTRPISGDYTGTQTRKTYNAIKDALIRRYTNPSSEYDFIKSDATFSQKSNFRQSIEDNSRTLSSYWLADDGADLPPPLIGIGLEVSAIPSGSYVSIKYEAENTETCRSAYNNERDAGL